MKSSLSSTASIDWKMPLTTLVKGKKPSPTIQKLVEAGINTVEDLVWVLPLRMFKTPICRRFGESELNQFFQGSGKIIHHQIQPAYGRRGKGNILLYNGFIIVKDDLSNETMALRWFNLYPNQKKQLESLTHIHFLGQVQEYKAQRQIANPLILTDGKELLPFIIEYPTVNKVGGSHIKKLFDLLPENVWKTIPEILPALEYNKKMGLGEAFKIVHGKISSEIYSPDLKTKAEERLIYEEFLTDQLKIQTRRKFIKRKSAPKFLATPIQIAGIVSTLPFKLTDDQSKVINEIISDFSSGHPMMRMVQGDVGCGKTIVAYVASIISITNGHQVALMCPTEALAHQHFETFKTLNPQMKLDLLLGSTKAKEKKIILANLKNGQTSIIIGTHSLFQESVLFSKLGLAIIDEQHKFGVEQRLRLISKGNGTHSLIMTATPIPRTLSLAQYGDLDISSIKMMPTGRKGIKTRITKKINYEKYIEFVKLKLSLGEQAYFVFPAIEEGESMDIQNVKEGVRKYQTLLKDYRVEMLHGQMKSEEKEKIIQEFRDQKIQVLISTSVVEVGINVPNATIMSIYGPERFGLSSLHQLRGRVGRGEKSGFCFLVLEKEISPEIYQRLEVIEKNLDGFVIAEEDLKYRGEGDLFGVDQSGTITTNKLANFLTHTPILEKVIKDIAKLKQENPELIDPILERLAKDQKILDTI